ncbi:hypothetical protein [Nocardiopsis sp. CNT312]|uniref:hypothetical protein n=1 Tax=Nocardiopsis sp. CNT312 TaxID=1137268 RepID=UPI00048DB4ED|nr:hypothetical protein [Nocardiopsis sp. CNT312]
MKAQTSSRWDWLRLTETEGDFGQAVIFHENPDGLFTIENTHSNYDGYRYWSLDHDGVYLDRWESATPWEVHATNHGIVIGKGTHTLNALRFGERWLGGPGSKYADHDDFTWKLIKNVMFPIKVAEVLIGKGLHDMSDVEFALQPV